MRKSLFVAAVLATAVTTGAVVSTAQAQPYGWGGYGCCGYGMMGGYGYGPGYYRHGHMMGWDYDGTGYRRGDRGYRDEGGYRGQRLCWTETDSARGYGYYAPCRN